MTEHVARVALIRWISPERRCDEQACQSNAAAIDRLVRELERYRREDVPAFECWFFSQFGPKYTELNHRWSVRDFRKRMLDAIAEEVLRHNVASHVAYRAVRLRHEDNAGWEIPSASASERPAAAPEREMQRPLQALFGDREEAPTAMTAAIGAAVGDGTVSNRSRQLYRRLATALHPDRPASVRKKFGPLVDDFWFAVQRAYRVGDEASLERFAAFVAVRTNCSESLSAVPDLAPVKRELEVQRQRLLEALDRAQRSPAWQFTSTLEMKPMRQAIRAAVKERLHECIAAAKREERALETQLRALARPPVSRPRRRVETRRPAEPPAQMTFDF